MKLLLTKSEVKRAHKRYLNRSKRFGLFKDSDKDGVPDYRDGHPNNPRKHSFITAVATGTATAFASNLAVRELKKKEPEQEMNKVLDNVNPFILGKRLK